MSSLLASVGLCAIPAWADEAADAFGGKVRPVLEQYCFDCHDGGKAKGGVNLEQFETADAIWRDPKLWERVSVQLRDRVMPPAKKKQPTDEERAALAQWVHDALDHPDPARLPHDPGPALLHRLSRLEYNCTVRDLLGVDTHPADAFPPDGGGGAGFDNSSATLFLPPLLLEKYLAAADAVLEATKPERLLAVTPGEGRDERAAARENLSRLAQRAFRRPVAPTEIDGLLGIYETARGRGATYPEAVKLAAKAALVSPHFLFRIEANHVGGGEPYQVSDYELASRLSYFLWASMPDDELFRLAAEGKLHEPAVLDQQTRRLLADPKARDFAESFAAQWLRTKELHTSVAPAKDKFPQFTPELRQAFYEESVDFFFALLHDNLPLTDCLDCQYTFANEPLAKFYGIPDVHGPELRRVEVSDRNRGGILGMGAVLALTSYPRRTSPVLRGKWVMEEVLGTPPPPPPADVNTATVEKHDKGKTFRERLEVHRQDQKCAGCHARMDPLGFGLENFDAIGAWRTEAEGEEVDASGQLVDGAKFNGPAELKQLLLLRKDEFVRTVTEKMLAYALGRGLEPADWWPVQQIARGVAADGYRAQSLIIGIVRSFPFQYRRPSTAPAVAVTE